MPLFRTRRFRSAPTFGPALGLALCLGLVTAGCSTFVVEDISPEQRETAAYQTGYSDGCRTANERQNGFGSKVTRNEAISQSNPVYQAGWRSGYGSCGGSGTNSFDTVFNEGQWF